MKHGRPRRTSTGGTLLAGAGRAKVHDNQRMLNKRARQQWKAKHAHKGEDLIA